MNRTRGLGIIRLSKSADPASTSIDRQREHIEAFAAQHDIELVGPAIDTATSAFHIPPERRKAVKEWLDRPDAFDSVIYWRQDRLVRRAADFMGLVTWCKANGKALYSATEGTGDVTQHTGVLLGFIKAWQAEGESQSTSDRVKDSQRKLAELGRWRGGRLIYGSRPVCVCHGLKACLDKKASGWMLEPATGEPEYEHCRELIRRVTAGQSVNSVMADFNKRGIPSTDGKLWNARPMWKMLRNRALLDVGIVDAAEWNELQDALNLRAANRTVRTATASPWLDLFFCSRCGGKIYRWRETKRGILYGRCRNEVHRYDTEHPCTLPRIPYESLDQAVAAAVARHADELIEKRATDHTRHQRLDDIAKKLTALLPKVLAEQIDQDEFLASQTALMDERRKLREATGDDWDETGETVGQRWARLDDDARRRLWLLSTGVHWTVDHEVREDGANRWVIADNWGTSEEKAGVRERFKRPAA